MSKFFIVLGLASLIIFAFLLYQRYTPRNLSFDIHPLNNTLITSTHSFPKAIIIDRLHLTLPIIPAKIENNRWEATTAGISYLISSAIPGEVGNSILYGHNWQNLLGPLPSVKPGDKIAILYHDDTKKNFIVKYTAIVSPDQTSILNPTTDKRLTLYTCTGFLDTKRFVVTAILKG